jgi:hypothetical protein
MWSVLGSILGWAFIIWLAAIVLSQFMRARVKSLKDLTKSPKEEDPKP